MKIQLLNNQELIIKARNEKDFQAALVVANKIAEHDDIDICSYCEFEMWVHITAMGSQGNAEFLNELYKQYK